MSDNSSFSIIVTEGVYDVVAIGKILRIKGFQEANHIEEIPDSLENIIPKQYSFEGSELSRRVPYPSFFFREDSWILVSNAGSDSKLMSNLKEILKEGLIKSTCADWRANFHALRGKKSQEYFVYSKIF